MNIQNVRANL